MVRPNEYLKKIKRDVQSYDSRDGILRLDMNEYVPNASRELYAEWMEKITPETISAYPMVNSAYHAISNLTGIPESKIVLTAGSDGVILSTLLSFCNTGDTVAMVIPTYGMYAVYAAMLGLKMTNIEYDGFDLDCSEILDSITPEIKVLMLANPNGVIGENLSYEVICSIIKKANQCGTILLLDEVYAAFVDYGNSQYAELVDQYDNLIIARSFSKSYGLAGLRAGYAISNAETRKYLIAVRTNVEINSAAVMAINVWCAHPDLMRASIEEIIESRDYVVTALENMKLEVRNGSGNFILMKVPKDLDDGFRLVFEQQNIAVKWLEIGGRKWLRITIGTRVYMEKFISAVLTYMEKQYEELYE